MSSLIKLALIPFALLVTWTSFAYLDLRSSDGNTDLLQEGTSVLYESFNNVPIHCGAYPKLNECIDGARSSPLEKTILFGNSQLHAVNNISENSELVALRLFKSSLQRNEYALTISYGNANFEEIFWALNQVLSSIEPKRIYLASVFDDMREVGLRPDMLEEVNDENGFQQKEVIQKRNYFPGIDFQGISEEAITRVKPIFNVSGNFAEKLNLLKDLLADSEVGKEGIEELAYINEKIEALGLATVTLDLDVTLARGLNYYTGAIFEVAAPEGVKMGSIGGGGRYDDLTGIFGLKNMSGVGISFGLDRIYLVLEE